MRLLYLTQWFDPEPNVIKGSAFVRALVDAGHDVAVVTGLPNYPAGKLYPGYRPRPIQRETIAGIEVIRLPLYPSHDRSSVRRSLNYLSFFLSALLYCLFRRRSFDLAYVYHPPITVGVAAALAGLVRRLPFVLDVQDLWPDTIAATGMPGAAKLTSPINALCDFVYRRAEAVIVQSEGIRRVLIERGVPAAKVSTILNWADIGEPLADRADACPGARFRIVYGGNLGRAQGIETLIDAAAILQRRRDDIEVRLYGDGVDAEPQRDRAASLGLANLRFEDRLSKNGILAVFQQADALLMHLADDPLFAITIPSKTQFYLAMGRPIVAGVAGDAAAILRQAGMVVVPPGDSMALADSICDLADLSADQREQIGRAGQRFYRERLSFDRGVTETLDVLCGINVRDRQREPIAAT